MNHLKYRGLGISLSQKRRRMHNVVLVTFIAIVAIVLASCGSPAAGQSNQASPVPTITVVPSSTPTTAPALTPTSTPKPTTSPQPTVTPTQPAAPAILDVRPSSMSIVGHLDCNRASTYVCLARVLSRADAQSDLHWVAFTNVPGNIGFSPSSGVLAPGQSVLITITIPFNACTPGLFFFRGPVNTHTITWAC